jgi:ferredoxin
MKIILDRDRCVGHGLCVLEAPDLFDIGDDSGLAVILNERPEGEDVGAAESAVAGCPERALTIE